LHSCQKCWKLYFKYLNYNEGHTTSVLLFVYCFFSKFERWFYLLFYDKQDCITIYKSSSITCMNNKSKPLFQVLKSFCINTRRMFVFLFYHILTFWEWKVTLSSAVVYLTWVQYNSLPSSITCMSNKSISLF